VPVGLDRVGPQLGHAPTVGPLAFPQQDIET
jgi:hypothetical protein